MRNGFVGPRGATESGEKKKVDDGGGRGKEQDGEESRGRESRENAYYMDVAHARKPENTVPEVACSLLFFFCFARC